MPLLELLNSRIYQMLCLIVEIIVVVLDGFSGRG